MGATNILSESQIEYGFHQYLIKAKYRYRSDIKDVESLERNFREKFEALNKVRLTNTEFARLLEQIINPDVFTASTMLRAINTFEREDGTPLHYTLVNTKDWCKNTFEVINQFRVNTYKSFHRYDVILLINGLPLVQIELKNAKISPREAMKQIVEYKQDRGNGYTNTLLCFMQIFIVSNSTNTYYFANNNNKHFSFDADERFLPIYQYADRQNKKIVNLEAFADTFLSKCTLGEMISRYMVLVQNERKLMIMRPYQVYAVESIIECIDDNRGNGYIWHTTGSGKTLTSFKASTILKENQNIYKCLFVVDRKDLDRQTREEFNKFQENCVEENTNTRSLIQKLLSEDYADKVIVTTIQKLGLALDATSKREYKKQLQPLSNKRLVFIFDECHRSQFGKNHQAIKEFFPRSQLFGFTGTPIFGENASYKTRSGEEEKLVTTEDIFEKELHSYTITHAIDDRNVLRFHIDYFKPAKGTGAGSGAGAPEGSDTGAGAGAGAPKAGTGAGVSCAAVVKAILKKHAHSTFDRKFNALLASASINHAIELYQQFKNLEQAGEHDLNIGCVFTPPAEGNLDMAQYQEDLATEREDNRHEPEKKKAALRGIIDDYNAKFGTGFTINEFDSYYQDIQTRIKQQQYPNADVPLQEKLDIVIVVDMLLTGFDSKYLNTLYVDKNLKYHGLIQAFSRTNRILNNSKPHGSILDFRSQESAVDAAIRRFSGEQLDRAKEIWLVDPADKVIKKFRAQAETLQAFMASHQLDNRPEEVANLKGDEARMGFIRTFKELQRTKIALDQYTDLSAAQAEQIEAIIPKATFVSFKTMYLETSKKLRESQKKKDGGSDEAGHLDFEFVLFASALVDYDYIMKLIAEYTQQAPEKRKMFREQIASMLSSSSNCMDEQDTINAYVDSLEAGKPLTEDAIKEGYEDFKNRQNATRLNALAGAHHLAPERLREFVDGIMSLHRFDAEQLTDLLTPRDLGWKDRRNAELALMAELSPLLKTMARGRDIAGLETYDE